MQIIGVDLHTRQQTVAMLNVETGEIVEKTLRHEGDSVREFYSTLAGPTRVGIEATGSMQWFLELMEELGIDCQIGHPAKIRAAEPRKQKHDRRDAALVLQLLVENRFPSIWMPSSEQRDVRSLILYRHQWVRIRTRVQNALQAIALSHGLRRGSSLWSKAGQQAIASLSLTRYTAERRTALQSLYRQLEQQIADLNQKVEELAWLRPQAKRLMTHPGVEPITALATETFLGEPKRFVDGKAVASYVGLIPSEHSSGGRQRFGRLSKQGNPLLRFLWREAVGHAVRKDAELQRFYQHKLVQKGLGKAKVAAARKLGIRLWILLRDQIDYQEFCRRGQLRQKHGGAHAGMPAREHESCAAVIESLNRRPASSRCGEFEELIMVSKDRRDVWWATPGR
jgi:transposase